MTTIHRQPLPPVHANAGGYCTPDPNDDGVMTAWLVDKDGRLHRYPSQQRWEPRCPPFLDVPRGPERHDARATWYADVYYPWKERVVEQINADPVAAARQFARRHPQEAARQAFAADAERRRRWWDLERAKRRRVDELLAALLADGGRSVSAIMETFGFASRASARELIAAGRQAWAQDRAGARRRLVDQHVTELGLARAEKLVDGLLAAAGRDGG